jgi:hypothetical protein
MRILTTICAAALLLCGSLFAQSMVDQLTVHFSTPVVVGETSLPAGNVHIQVMRGSGSATLVFRAESGVTTTAVVNRIIDADSSDAGARLVLKNIGGTVRLDRVMMGDHTGFQLLP